MACVREEYKRLAFMAEWYQEEAAKLRTFTMLFYTMDNSVAIFENRYRRLFLRRTRMPGLTESDLFVGSKIDIFGRQFDIVGYADVSTKATLAKYRQKTFILLKSTMIPQLGKIICALVDSGFHVNKAVMVQLTGLQVKAFMGERYKGEMQTTILLNELITSPAIGLEVVCDNAVKKINYCQSQSAECNSADMPTPLVELFKDKDFRNGIHCAQTEEEASHDSDFFFGPKTGLNLTLVLKNSTLCIIKPHAIKEGNLGKILSEITRNNFRIAGLRMNLMERVNCEEFLNVYFTIVQEYMPMVAQLASGVCMALELVCNDPNKDTHAEFRKFVGPKDPEIAKLLRPGTLRATYGVNKVMNAVHCTDLPDDTKLELQYMFKIVQ